MSSSHAWRRPSPHAPHHLRRIHHRRAVGTLAGGPAGRRRGLLREVRRRARVRDGRLHLLDRRESLRLQRGRRLPAGPVLHAAGAGRPRLRVCARTAVRPADADAGAPAGADRGRPRLGRRAGGGRRCAGSPRGRCRGRASPPLLTGPSGRTRSSGCGSAAALPSRPSSHTWRSTPAASGRCNRPRGCCTSRWPSSWRARGWPRDSYSRRRYPPDASAGGGDDMARALAVLLPMLSVFALAGVACNDEGDFLLDDNNPESTGTPAFFQRSPMPSPEPSPSGSPAAPNATPVTPFQVTVDESVNVRESPSTQGGPETGVGTFTPGEEKTVAAEVRG